MSFRVHEGRELFQSLIVVSDDSWAEFYRRYDPFVRSVVSSSGITRTDFEDRVQDAWVALIQSLPDLQLDPTRGTLLAWIRTVVFRATRDGQRHRARWAPSPDSQEIVESIHDSRMPTPAAQCEGRERRKNVRLALRLFRHKTSRTNYRVLYLMGIKGLSVDEVARRLNLTPPQVWTRHHRSKREFLLFVRSQDFFR